VNSRRQEATCLSKLFKAKDWRIWVMLKRSKIFFTCFSCFLQKIGNRFLQKAHHLNPHAAVQPKNNLPFDGRQIWQIIDKLYPPASLCTKRSRRYRNVALKISTEGFVIALTRQIYEFLLGLQTFRLLKK
jgi:hypothetical protein